MDIKNSKSNFVTKIFAEIWLQTNIVDGFIVIELPLKSTVNTEYVCQRKTNENWSTWIKSSWMKIKAFSFDFEERENCISFI